MSLALSVRFRGLGEICALPQECWLEMDRLSRDGDPDTQAALDRLLQRRGRVLHRVRAHNLTTTVGLNHAIGAILPNGICFVGAKGAGAPAVGNTMSSHAPWLELTTYLQATRPALTLGFPAVGGVADNTASVALFTAPTGGMTFNGWFVVTNSVKGGTTGTLISVADHGSPQTLAAGIVLRQTLTATVS